MRREIWLGLFGAVMFAGCDKPKIETAEAPAPATEATPPPVVQEEVPQDLPPAPAVPAGPKVDDEVYLVRRFSIPIDGGMRGFREGSKVKVVSIQEDKLTVMGNEVQFDVQMVDISLEPPAAPAPQSAPPKAAAGAPASAAKPSDLEKKKERNRITAELSNLQMASNKSTEAVSQIQARMKQIQDVMYSGSRSFNSPEGRARQAELDRLDDALRKQVSEGRRIKDAISLKQRELKKVDSL